MKHSHSSLKCFETCPRLYQHKYVLRTYKEPVSKKAEWGITVHQHLESRIKKKQPLPKELNSLAPVIDIIEKYPGNIFVEHRLAVNAYLQPVDYFDEKAWLRGVVDLCKVHVDRGFVADYKTGNIRNDTTQLQLSSLLLMAQFPQVESVLAMFLWNKYSKITKEKYSRSSAADMWDSFLYRIRIVEDAVKDGNFAPRVGWMCSYCYVKSCEYCKNRNTVV